MNRQWWSIDGPARTLAALAVLVLAAGCVSTPERRIAKHPELFAGFAPGVQAQIRRGEIDIGFTPDMVRLALGTPSRVVVRKTAAGTVDVWLYTALRYGTLVRPVPTGYTYRGRDGRIHHDYAMDAMDVGRSEEYVVLRIEFEDGKVRAIERMK